MQVKKYKKQVGPSNQDWPSDYSAQQVNTILQHNIIVYCGKKLGTEREDLCITTDGEQALIDACSTCFENSTMLRCTRHFEANCIEVLKKIGVPSKAEKIVIDIFGGESGLIKAEDKKDFKEKLKESLVLLSDLE